jgi:hypothetical protein
MSTKQRVRVIRLGHLKSKKFAGMAHTQKPVLKYNNGPLLANVEVFTVFWGGDWKNQPALASVSQSINDFFTFILTSPLIDQLSEYNIPGGTTIGHGSLVGSKTLSTDPANPIDDSAIQTALQGWIANDSDFPQANANSLYFIYFPPGTTITLQGDSSCQSFGGYHDSFKDSSGKAIFYAVEPFCMPFQSGMSQLDFLTLTSSHELCESITDPIPGEGWYWFKDQQNQGEIGDICEAAPNAEERMGTFLVQREWSNKHKKCV